MKLLELTPTEARECLNNLKSTNTDKKLQEKISNYLKVDIRSLSPGTKFRHCGRSIYTIVDSDMGKMAIGSNNYVYKLSQFNYSNIEIYHGPKSSS